MQQSAESQEGFSLLYVEDEIETRMLLTSMIEHKYPSLKLHTARNGQEGIESYSQQLADIIVTDISMPYMNGLQMARKIRESNPEVMIIVLTARTDTQYLLDSIDIGINQYVLKPVDNKLCSQQ